jgi:hypothetical protein
MNPSFLKITNNRYNPDYHYHLANYRTVIANLLRSEVATYTTIKINLYFRFTFLIINLYFLITLLQINTVP